MNRPKLYQICDLVIESNILLPELVPALSSTPDFHFELLAAGAPFAGEHHWFNHWRFQGEARLSFAFRHEDYLLRFPNQADFLIARSGSAITCQPLLDVPESTIRHLLLDSVVPLILSRQEPLVLHASGILMDDAAVAFIGTSGQGKSTLAASHGQNGRPVIADDFLVLRRVAGEWVGLPSYPGIRLLPGWCDEIFEISRPAAKLRVPWLKRRISDRELIPFTKSPSKMLCLYLIDDDGKAVPEEPTIERVSQRETFIKLVSSSFNLDITDKELLRRQFATLKQVVSDLPCYRLRYAREFGTLPAVSRAIESHQESIRDVPRPYGPPQTCG